MKILVLGGGGREHALVWKLRESPRVEKIWCAPGMAASPRRPNAWPLTQVTSPQSSHLPEKIHPDLTIVGPECPW